MGATRLTVPRRRLGCGSSLRILCLTDWTSTSGCMRSSSQTTSQFEGKSVIEVVWLTSIDMHCVFESFEEMTCRKHFLKEKAH